MNENGTETAEKENMTHGMNSKKPLHDSGCAAAFFELWSKKQDMK